MHATFRTGVLMDIPPQNPVSPKPSLSGVPELQRSKDLFRKPLAIQAWDDTLQRLPETAFVELFDEHVHSFTNGSTKHLNSAPLSSWAV